MTGLLTGVKTGQVNVTAESSGKTGVSIVTVTQGTKMSIQLTPNSADNFVLASGNALQFEARLIDVNGNSQLSDKVLWSVVNGTGSASISSSGVVNGVSVGIVTIVAQ